MNLNIDSYFRVVYNRHIENFRYDIWKVIVMQEIHSAHAKVFKAFCDEKRLVILEMLRDGEKCACQILDDMDIGQSTLSHHMKILTDSGIVESRKDGKWTYYSISTEGSQIAYELLLSLTKKSNTNSSICSCSLCN